jgi:tetratricopeptide (TPR) repeat protein
MPFYRFVDLVATWTLFQLHASSGEGFLTKTRRYIRTFFKLSTPSEEFVPLGTKDWQSYAYFKAGVGWSMEGRKDKARQLYLEALSRDMNNHGALFNLGVMDMESGEYDKAVERLMMARNSVEQEKMNNLHSDPVWYGAMYQLAASYQYKVIKAEEEPEKANRELDKAEETAKELVAEIKAGINAFQKDENKALQQYLESFKPMAVILYAGILMLMSTDIMG